MKPLAKFPFEPLWAASRCTTAREFAEQVGSTLQAINCYRSSGLINYLQADRYACALGFHPVEIWPDFICDELPEQETKAS